MPDLTYQYSIIRLSPDPLRGEIVNIGIIVFRPGALDIRLIENFSKVKILNPDIDTASIIEHQNAIAKAIGELDADTAISVVNGMNTVQLSPPGTFIADTEKTYEKRIESIMKDLVIPRVKKARPRHTTMISKLKNDFRRMKLLGTNPEDIKRHRVVANYPIAADEKLYADFALKNGQWHITETLDLRGKPDTIKGDKYKQAAVRAITLERAAKRLQDCVPIIIYAADEIALELANYHINLLTDSAEMAFNYLDNNDMARYFQYISTAAGQNNMFH